MSTTAAFLRSLIRKTLFKDWLQVFLLFLVANATVCHCFRRLINTFIKICVCIYCVCIDALSEIDYRWDIYSVCEGEREKHLGERP